MSNDLEKLTTHVKNGQLNRRDFLRAATALGVAAPLASSMLSQNLFAAEKPKKGGHLIAGLEGGELHR